MKTPSTRAVNIFLFILALILAALCALSVFKG